MKKIKVSLLILAIIAGVGGAFVNKKTDPMCGFFQQYYLNGGTYSPAGEMGYDYDCDYDPSIPCTYWEYDRINHPGEYAACHTGTYIWIPHD